MLATLQMWTFNIFTSDKKQSIGVNKYMEHQTFETFGTSSCWWSQTIDNEEDAREIARLLYDDETGLGLDIYRYNIGGGEKDNPDCRIWDVTRRTESFYVYNPEKAGMNMILPATRMHAECLIWQLNTARKKLFFSATARIFQ